ncbi:Steryl-sulfatase [Flagellimonas maritima]|uniref:Steryl-sulfatase n=1 Tax=Flagellimonas maritima TaxID=1383885 RepID=A0A2Z4LQ08_9FLAO|nr:sulfatase [Allomuricauda aurantiaca]AWX43664.1 Steryl-sulfatase [Allomuricauda aurantiaca]
MKYSFLFIVMILFADCSKQSVTLDKPNILFVISDDQSFGHTSFGGSSFIETPGFDRIAREGIYFTNAYAGSPGCAPSRSAIVTGRHHWQNEHSGQHASSWMKKHVPFVDELSASGYRTGKTGKGVDPFQYARNDSDSLWRTTNAAGRDYSSIKYDSHAYELPSDKISKINYFENFKEFVNSTEKDQPFFFWFGANEPHRAYEKNSWKKTDKKLSDVTVPEFLPDTDEVRGDMLDYAVEIEWFDSHLQKMIAYLEDIGELGNTIIIVTSDNGMPFPRAKANSYEYGAHVPLAIRYPKKFKSGRTIDDHIQFVDFAPTILDLANRNPQNMLPITGTSFVNVLENKKDETVNGKRKYSFVGRERHSCSRHNNLGYPQRAVFTDEFVLIWNMKSQRWPAGAPQRFSPNDATELLPYYGLDATGTYINKSAFLDVDDCPTKTQLIEEKDSLKLYFDYSFAKRPEIELYNTKKDPACLKNLAELREFKDIKEELFKILKEELVETNDPRVMGENPEIFDTYKRYSKMRKFPEPN